MNPRGHDPIDFRDCAGQLLAERADQACAILDRGRDHALAGKDGAEIVEFFTRQAVGLENIDGFSEPILLHHHRQALVLGGTAAGGDAVLHEKGEDFVRIALIEAAMQLDLAGRNQEAEAENEQTNHAG